MQHREFTNTQRGGFSNRAGSPQYVLDEIHGDTWLMEMAGVQKKNNLKMQIFLNNGCRLFPHWALRTHILLNFCRPLEFLCIHIHIYFFPFVVRAHLFITFTWHTNVYLRGQLMFIHPLLSL